MRAFLAATAVAAALFASVSGSSAQQRAAFCLRGTESGGLNCSFNTLAECEQAKKGADNTGTCGPNDPAPRSGAVGQGARPEVPPSPPPASR